MKISQQYAEAHLRAMLQRVPEVQVQPMQILQRVPGDCLIHLRNKQDEKKVLGLHSRKLDGNGVPLQISRVEQIMKLEDIFEFVIEKISLEECVAMHTGTKGESAGVSSSVPDPKKNRFGYKKGAQEVQIQEPEKRGGVRERRSPLRSPRPRTSQGKGNSRTFSAPSTRAEKEVPMCQLCRGNGTLPLNVGTGHLFFTQLQFPRIKCRPVSRYTHQVPIQFPRPLRPTIHSRPLPPITYPPQPIRVHLL